MIFDALVLLVGALAGAVAAVSGFGIGSLLTPVLAAHHGTKLAVAAVSIPHVIGTAVRFVKLREHVDGRAFVRFGILSAAGGLLGALIHSRMDAPVLSIVLGALLVFAGLSGLLGLAERLRLGRRTAWVAGMLSGLFGGLVGNQGGIRSAALMGFDLSKESFVATATAVALVVDGARMPVYVWTEGRSLIPLGLEIAAATAGVLLGTIVGVRVLRRIPEGVFRPSVSILITTLGVYMLLHR
ncbi:MAG TPA: sulfite exporter TauE/SafE family protein [Vicinamibacteria bacterium]|nr:sulfite exporter TauE/SafE family protein [Vicinamibacteria bacterium]